MGIQTGWEVYVGGKRRNQSGLQELLSVVKTKERRLTLRVYLFSIIVRMRDGWSVPVILLKE